MSSHERMSGLSRSMTSQSSRVSRLVSQNRIAHDQLQAQHRACLCLRRGLYLLRERAIPCCSDSIRSRLDEALIPRLCRWSASLPTQRINDVGLELDIHSRSAS